MRRAAFACLVATGCAADAASERWRWEQVVWEGARGVTRPGAAATLAERLAKQPALSFDDCWRLALHRSESLALDGEALVQLAARRDQAIGNALPRVALAGGVTWQDTTGVASGSGVQGERVEWRLTARQPLFQGLREVHAIRRAGAQADAQAHTLRHARLALYADVADACYDVLEVARELATTADSLAVARERLLELTERQRVGVSRRSEVLAQEAAVASLEASVEALRGAQTVAWEVWRFLTGVPGSPTLADATTVPSEAPALAPLVAAAVAGRADVRGLERGVDATDAGVDFARGGFWPTIRLDTNWWWHREGTTRDVDWDVALTGEWPLWDWGATRAVVREAESGARGARLALEQRRREVSLAVRRSHADLATATAQIGSLVAAEAAAAEHHAITAAEYRLGIVTNLEVLTALERLRQTRLDLDRARYRAKRAAVHLAVEAGATPPGMAS